ncbi:MAG TPA: alpha/beta hydrolase [Bryobacteraceae bacterium]|nr:alpha/beta hydrolase [Bryobacteraceae bacterium]
MTLRPGSESPALHILSLDPVPLAVWEWSGASDAQHSPLVFAHATGFHGRLWDTVIGALPGRHAFAVELRGHGRSGKPDPPYHWRAFGSDLAMLVRALHLHDAIGIGHSSGGHAMTLACTLAPEAFRALLLIDPTIFPAERYTEPKLDASFTLRRKNRYQSVEEMIERFRSREPFSRWNPDVFRDYCRYGLLPDGDHLVLACPPPVEASIYAESNAPESNIYPEIARIEQPVTVLRAGTARQPGVFDLSASPTAPDLASRFRRGRDLSLAGQSHFIPMEVPERLVDEIRKIA